MGILKKIFGSRPALVFDKRADGANDNKTAGMIVLVTLGVAWLMFYSKQYKPYLEKKKQRQALREAENQAATETSSV